MMKPKLRRISLIPLILAMPASEVTFSPDMQELREALYQRVCDTFTTWQGPAIQPLPKTTQKICRVWRRSNGGMSELRIS